jgi:hypothetical protein
LTTSRPSLSPSEALGRSGPSPEPENGHGALESRICAERLIAIDPGNEVSAWLIYDPILERPIEWADEEPNYRLRNTLAACGVRKCVIEGIQSFGMPVGKDVLDTCIWIGRFIESWVRTIGNEPTIVYRKDIKHHLCGTHRAKDKNVSQALIDRFGPGRPRAVGTIRKRGPLYGISGHVWSALAIAVTAADTGRVAGKSEHHSV